MPPAIFISGGSRGIGLAIARKFHAEGFRTAVCARSGSALDAARSALPGLLAYRCDLGDKAQVKALARQLTEDLGPLDVLVNNAGIYRPGRVMDEDESVFEELMAVNLHSAYYLTRGLLPPMLERRSGLIVNMSSVAGLQAYPNGGSYSISKFALTGFSRNLREELKPYGIRVTALMPGAVFTDSWEGSGVPEERLMPAEDIASLVWNAWTLSARSVVEDLVIRPQAGDL
ncbi:MAG: SDR family oxidoreductase [Bacteroidia bacterium]|nr:SDR family oxidoreductase [Bacteroidia bacterium]